MLEQPAILTIYSGQQVVMGAALVGHPQSLTMKLDQLLHLVDRALQLVDVHANVTKLAVEHQIAG